MSHTPTSRLDNQQAEGEALKHAPASRVIQEIVRPYDANLLGHWAYGTAQGVDRRQDPPPPLSRLRRRRPKFSFPERKGISTTEIGNCIRTLTVRELVRQENCLPASKSGRRHATKNRAHFLDYGAPPALVMMIGHVRAASRAMHATLKVQILITDLPRSANIGLACCVQFASHLAMPFTPSRSFWREALFPSLSTIRSESSWDDSSSLVVNTKPFTWHHEQDLSALSARVPCKKRWRTSHLMFHELGQAGKAHCADRHLAPIHVQDLHRQVDP